MPILVRRRRVPIAPERATLMAEPIKQRASSYSAASSRGRTPQQQAARDQLHEHIDDEKLQAFLWRTIDSNEHANIVEHLNACEPCREAIAVVLLAGEDPKAAVELQMKRRRRLSDDSEPWQRRALRWTAISFALMIVLAIGVFWPAAKNSDSRYARWFVESSEASLSETSISNLFPSTVVEPPRHEEEKPAPASRRRSGDRQVRQPGWDTGPAPYPRYVEPSAPYVEVSLPREHSSKTAFGSTTGNGTAWNVRTDDRASQEDSWQSRSSRSGQSPAATRGEASAPRKPSERLLVVASDGSLRRTLDGGATWQDISVGPNVRLRALALSGTTVWAAGDEGALYRSPDAAENWQRVSLSYRQVPMTSDIAKIHFSDPQHGEIVTRDGQIWITVDGGQKWNFSPTGLP